MTILLSMTILVAVVAVAVTFFSVAGAKDGYEDESGFHVICKVAAMKSSVTVASGLQHGPSVGFHSPLPSA